MWFLWFIDVLSALRVANGSDTRSSRSILCDRDSWRRTTKVILTSLGNGDRQTCRPHSRRRHARIDETAWLTAENRRGNTWCRGARLVYPRFATPVSPYDTVNQFGMVHFCSARHDLTFREVAVGGAVRPP
jgi:hypothetical protein